jgi:dolichol-phosphate mannosyltransferase
MAEKSLVIIPTYDEFDNVHKIIPDVLERDESIDVLIVDDNSPDGTGKYVEELSKSNPRVKLIKRPGKMGLGTAYIEGFKYAISNNYDFIFEMDADFSHDPKEINNFLTAIRKYDVVIGSRYINGVNVINWPMQRLLLSYFANAYSRFITGIPIRDATGGFKCFRRKVLESISFQDIKSNGYSFQIEMNYKAWKKGFALGEIPIIFSDRVKGTSKMSKKIIREAVFMVWKLRLRSILGILK